MKKAKRKVIDPAQDARNKANKTADHANPRSGGRTKREANLDRRRRDFSAGSKASSADKQGSRWDSGGFHRPGSYNK